MQEYVVIDVIDQPWYDCNNPYYDCNNRILLLRKARGPEHNIGKLNLVGGHIELYEKPVDAAVRELAEETNLVAKPEQMYYFGKIYGEDWRVYFYTAAIYSYGVIPNNSDETEPVKWYKWSDVINGSELVSNLKILVPLMRQGVRDWNILSTSLESVVKGLS